MRRGRMNSSACCAELPSRYRSSVSTKLTPRKREGGGKKQVEPEEQEGGAVVTDGRARGAEGASVVKGVSEAVGAVACDAAGVKDVAFVDVGREEAPHTQVPWKRIGNRSTLWRSAMAQTHALFTARVNLPPPQGVSSGPGTCLL